MYSCKVKKYGTLRPNTNFVLAISRLLREQRKLSDLEPLHREPNSVNTTTIEEFNSLEIGKI